MASWHLSLTADLSHLLLHLHAHALYDGLE